MTHIGTGTRCYETDRGGENLPRGGIVIETTRTHLVIATSWGHRTKGRKANVPFINVEVIPRSLVDADTVELVGTSERVQVARAIAAVFATRRSAGRTEEDDRDLGRIAELMRQPVDPRYLDDEDLEPDLTCMPPASPVEEPVAHL